MQTGFPCPHCGTYALNKAGLSSAGKQRLRCRNCERSHVLHPERPQRYPEIYRPPACPQCSSPDCISEGRANNKQRWACKACGKTFYWDIALLFTRACKIKKRRKRNCEYLPDKFNLSRFS